MSVRLLILAAVAAAGAASQVRLDVPLYRQVDKGCGAASLAIVLAYWDGRHGQGNGDSPRALYDKLYSQEIKGIRLSDMKVYLSENGFHAFTMRATLDELDAHINKRRPVIVALQDGRRLHYAVVTGIDSDDVWLNDPARRKPQTMSRKRFERKWAGGDHWMLLAVPRS